jgi:hypothetical protein
MIYVTDKPFGEGKSVSDMGFSELLLQIASTVATCTYSVISDTDDAISSYSGKGEPTTNVHPSSVRGVGVSPPITSFRGLLTWF